MAKLGFKHRQVCSMGPTNHDNRYKGKLPGDSPELMPLDNNLFADFAKAILTNVCGTLHLGNDDPNKFSISTPDAAWLAMERTWEHEPSSKRIVQDIHRWEQSIQEVTF